MYLTCQTIKSVKFVSEEEQPEVACWCTEWRSSANLAVVVSEVPESDLESEGVRFEHKTSPSGP